MNLLTLNKGALQVVKDDTEAMGYLVGGVYRHPIKPDIPQATYGPTDPPGGEIYKSTPDAFDPEPPYLIRTCARVRIMHRQTHPAGGWGRIADVVEVWYYTRDTITGEEAGYNAMGRVRELFTRKPVPDGAGAGWIIEPSNDALAFEVTGEFTDALMAVERFYATYTGA